MKNNQVEAFFTLMKAGLWERDVNLLPFGKVDYEEVMRLAEEQAVTGLVTAGLEYVKDVPINKEILLQFIGATLQIEETNKSMNRFIADWVETMRKDAEIYTLLVKGQGIAQCYEKPLWRSSGDVDFFLNEENYILAKNFLCHRAESVEKESRGHIGMTIDSWMVELHGNIHCGLSSRIDRVIDEVQRDIFNGGNVRSCQIGKTQVFLPGVDNDVFFIFTHFLKHFYKGGLGIRQICDWCRLIWTYRDAINTPILENRLRSAGLMSEWRAFAAFAVEYLGMPVESMPLYSTNKKWANKAKRIMEFVMMSGNFGHNRDSSYNKYPFLRRKFYSMSRRVGDLIRHARIFPLDSFRFLPKIVFDGLVAASKGIG